MTIGQLAPGSTVFLDANILVYYFEPNPCMVRLVNISCAGLSKGTLPGSLLPT
jgi:hypothetical protein